MAGERCNICKRELSIVGGGDIGWKDVCPECFEDMYRVTPQSARVSTQVIFEDVCLYCMYRRGIRCGVIDKFEKDDVIFLKHYNTCNLFEKASYSLKLCDSTPKFTYTKEWHIEDVHIRWEGHG